jgi:hypothetical protein
MEMKKLKQTVVPSDPIELRQEFRRVSRNFKVTDGRVQRLEKWIADSINAGEEVDARTLNDLDEERIKLVHWTAEVLTLGHALKSLPR